MTGPPGLPRQPTGDLQQVQQIAGLILTLAGRLQDNYAAQAASIELTAGQSKVLMALQPGDSVPMRVLAERIRTDPSNLTGLIDKLESRSLVVRVPDQLDRRVKALVLTEEGIQVRARFIAQLTASAGPIAHLSTDQLTALRTALLPAVDTDGPMGEGSRLAVLSTGQDPT